MRVVGEWHGRLEYTEDGVTALLDLSHGDMRRVDNILQVSCGVALIAS